MKKAICHLGIFSSQLPRQDPEKKQHKKMAGEGLIWIYFNSTQFPSPFFQCCIFFPSCSVVERGGKTYFSLVLGHLDCWLEKSGVSVTGRCRRSKSRQPLRFLSRGKILPFRRRRRNCMRHGDSTSHVTGSHWVRRASAHDSSIKKPWLRNKR
jgi:hypothetical protein